MAALKVSESSIKQRVTAKLSRWPYSKQVRSEVITMGIALLGKTPDRPQLNDVELVLLRDYADCCERIEQGKEVADRLRLEDPAKWGAIVTKLQCEITLKQRLLKSLRVIESPGYEKKLSKPETGENWEGVL